MFSIYEHNRTLTIYLIVSWNNLRLINLFTYSRKQRWHFWIFQLQYIFRLKYLTACRFHRAPTDTAVYPHDYVCVSQNSDTNRNPSLFGANVLRVLLNKTNTVRCSQSSLTKVRHTYPDSRSIGCGLLTNFVPRNSVLQTGPLVLTTSEPHTPAVAHSRWVGQHLGAEGCYQGIAATNQFSWDQANKSTSSVNRLFIENNSNNNWASHNPTNRGTASGRGSRSHTDPGTSGNCIAGIEINKSLALGDSARTVNKEDYFRPVQWSAAQGSAQSSSQFISTSNHTAQGYLLNLQLVSTSTTLGLVEFGRCTELHVPFSNTRFSLWMSNGIRFFSKL